MKKIILIIAILSVQLNAQQSKAPVYPGCEKFQTKGELIGCFGHNVKEFSKTYFNLYENALSYFQYPNIDDQAYFQLTTQGRLIYMQNDKSTAVFNKMMEDMFFTFNAYLEHNHIKIQPALAPDGRPANLKFNLPFVSNKSVTSIEDGIEPIRFTLYLDQEYIICQNSNNNFVAYDSQGSKVSELSTMSSFYKNPIFAELLKTDKNLIVKKKLNNKNIEIYVHHLFKNQVKYFKISVVENDKIIKEYDTMNKFLKSEHSKLIY